MLLDPFPCQSSKNVTYNDKSVSITRFCLSWTTQLSPQINNLINYSSNPTLTLQPCHNAPQLDLSFLYMALPPLHNVILLRIMKALTAGQLSLWLIMMTYWVLQRMQLVILLLSQLVSSSWNALLLWSFGLKTRQKWMNFMLLLSLYVQPWLYVLISIWLMLR